MLVHTADLAGIKRIEPGPGGKLNDSMPDLIGDVSTREAGSSIVEQAHQIAVADAPDVGIFRVDPHRLPTSDLASLAEVARV